MKFNDQQTKEKLKPILDNIKKTEEKEKVEMNVHERKLEMDEEVKVAVESFTKSLETKPKPSKEGARYDQGKNRYDLLPFVFVDELVKVYTFGCIKYDDDNWWKGMPWKKVIGPLFRHITKWCRGEKYDDESGCHHLAHVVWNCITLFEYERNKIGKDNRCPYGLDLMDENERNKRISKWRQLADDDKLDEYNGLDV